jgi:hypothetical protein
MIEEIAKNFVKLKQEFAGIYYGTSNIQEVIPISKSEMFPIDKRHLELLHVFAKKNPIYYNSYEQKICDVNCIVYEGDINKYWLSSIQHDSSRAPFSPTWIFSAYLCSLFAKELGFTQIFDIGSGDGRIAYCAKILNLYSCSIEIDETLVDLQQSISDSTGIDFHPKCHDAISFNYASLNLNNTAFFIGGLAQMGGIALATGILDNVKSQPLGNSGMVLTGTLSKKYPTDPMSEAGWGTLIHKYRLRVIGTVILPTMWTFKESVDTPYIFAKMS